MRYLAALCLVMLVGCNTIVGSDKERDEHTFDSGVNGPEEKQIQPIPPGCKDEQEVVFGPEVDKQIATCLTKEFRNKITPSDQLHGGGFPGLKYCGSPTLYFGYNVKFDSCSKDCVIAVLQKGRCFGPKLSCRDVPKSKGCKGEIIKKFQFKVQEPTEPGLYFFISKLDFEGEPRDLVGVSYVMKEGECLYEWMEFSQCIDGKIQKYQHKPDFVPSKRPPKSP